MQLDEFEKSAKITFGFLPELLRHVTLRTLKSDIILCDWLKRLPKLLQYEYIDESNAVLTIQTFLKLRHDIVERVLMLVFKVSKILLVTPDKLTPDICFKVDDIMYFIDVSLTFNHTVLVEKYKKYSSVAPTFIFTYSNQFSLGKDADKFLADFLATSGTQLDDYRRFLKSQGSDDSRIVESMDLFDMSRTSEPIDWGDLSDSENLDTPSEDIGFDKICDHLKECMDDPTIAGIWGLSDTESGVFSKSFEDVVDNMSSSFDTREEYKPTFLFFCPMNSTVTTRGVYSEQELIRSQLSELKNFDTPLKSFFSEALNVLSDKDNWNVFCTGIPKSSQSEPELRKAYQMSDLYRKKTFLEFVCSSAGLKAEKLLSKRPKTLTISYPTLDEQSVEFLKRSKTHMSSEEFVRDKLEKVKKIESKERRKMVDLERYEGQIEKFSMKLTDPVDFKLPQILESMLYTSGPDEKFFTYLKDSATNEFKTYLKLMSGTRVLSWGAKLVELMEQTLHLQEISLSANNYTFYNSGLSNTLYVMRDSKHDKGKDTGKAFLIVFMGILEPYERDIYGFSHQYSNGKGKYVYFTKWRRLPSQRITFHIDQYFSTLATSYASYKRRISGFVSNKQLLAKEIRMAPRVLSLRMIVGFSHSQQSAEMLSDIRYMFMNSFSEFSSTRQFILDKYTKPVATCLEHYIVKLIPLFDFVQHDYLNGGVRTKSAVYLDAERDLNTLGGSINLPSVFFPGTRILSMQDLLDEMFLYVHTNKEPSSNYHEYVKAYKTIVKYQTIYDSLEGKYKSGVFTDIDEWKAFFLQTHGVGHHSESTRIGANLICSKLDGQKISSAVENSAKHEGLLEMNSTKSIIPERGRIDVKLTLQNTRATGHSVKGKRKNLWNQMHPSHVDPYEIVVTTDQKDGDNLIVLKGTNRCKVHDSTLNIMEHMKIYRTIDLAIWNIKENNGRVHTDICIKAQYGAKREFYVINHGAKAMARIVENSFKILAQEIEQEMISVKGDNKMYEIQRLIDKANVQNVNSTHKMYFCNGDCTKWSAAETMEGLNSFVNGTYTVFTTDQMNFYKKVLFLWSKKTIQVPYDMNKNVYFNIEGVSRDPRTVLNSSQNFLQGMFNYLSSCKAVACTEFTYLAWKKIYPASTLTLQHMEHSDDYAFVVVTPDTKSFKQFKLLHRLCMRLFGITDSLKKTNCQQFLLEFISLISFNGVMTYPQIKKIKEVGLNIGCLGFSSDIKNTCSRVGEAMRVGVPADVCYVMSRIQNIRIASAYGLLTSNTHLYPNDFHYDATSFPVELWGLPDSHPIFYLYCSGDPNNWRLGKYGSDLTKSLLSTLYLLNSSKGEFEDGDTLNLTEENPAGFYHPSYRYIKDTKLLKAIRNSVDTTYDKVSEYWNKHPVDNYMKPRDPERGMEWLKSKYFQRSFAEAYMRQSRAKLQLRLSHYVSQKCISVSINNKKFSEIFSCDASWASEDLTLTEYFASFLGLVGKHTQNFESLMASDKLFLQTLCGFDLQIPLIYKRFENSGMSITSAHTRNLRAYIEPSRDFTTRFSNRVSTVLQYIYSNEDFLSDGIPPSNIQSLLNDVHKHDILVEACGLTDSSRLLKIRYIYAIGVSQARQTKPLLMYENPKGNLNASIDNTIAFQSFSGKYVKIMRDKNELFLHGEQNSFSDVTDFLRSDSVMPVSAYNYSSSLLSDLVLLWAYCVGRGIPFAKEIICGLTINVSGTHSETAEEFLSAMSSKYLDGSLKANDTLVKGLCALSILINGDHMPAQHYVSRGLAYSYKYNKNTPADGYTTVDLRYRNEEFVLVFRETHGKPGHNLTIYTSTDNVGLYAPVYCIGLRLMGSISVGVFLRTMQSSTIRNIPTQEPLNFIQLLYSKFQTENFINTFRNSYSNKISYTKSTPNDHIIPIVLASLTPIKESLTVDNHYYQTSLDEDTMTLYTGLAKLFTVPFKGLTQTNCWDYSGKYKMDIPIEWLLKNDNLSSLTHGNYIVNFESLIKCANFQDVEEHDSDCFGFTYFGEDKPGVTSDSVDTRREGDDLVLTEDFLMRNMPKSDIKKVFVLEGDTIVVKERNQSGKMIRSAETTETSAFDKSFLTNLDVLKTYLHCIETLIKYPKELNALKEHIGFYTEMDVDGQLQEYDDEGTLVTQDNLVRILKVNLRSIINETPDTQFSDILYCDTMIAKATDEIDESVPELTTVEKALGIYLELSRTGKQVIKQPNGRIIRSGKRLTTVIACIEEKRKKSTKHDTDVHEPIPDEKLLNYLLTLFGDEIPLTRVEESMGVTESNGTFYSKDGTVLTSRYINKDEGFMDKNVQVDERWLNNIDRQNLLKQRDELSECYNPQPERLTESETFLGYRTVQRNDKVVILDPKSNIVRTANRQELFLKNLTAWFNHREDAIRRRHDIDVVIESYLDHPVDDEEEVNKISLVLNRDEQGLLDEIFKESSEIETGYHLDRQTYNDPSHVVEISKVKLSDVKLIKTQTRPGLPFSISALKQRLDKLPAKLGIAYVMAHFKTESLSQGTLLRYSMMLTNILRTRKLHKQVKSLVKYALNSVNSAFKGGNNTEKICDGYSAVFLGKQVIVRRECLINTLDAQMIIDEYSDIPGFDIDIEEGSTSIVHEPLSYQDFLSFSETFEIESSFLGLEFQSYLRTLQGTNKLLSRLSTLKQKTNTQ